MNSSTHPLPEILGTKKDGGSFQNSEENSAFGILASRFQVTLLYNYYCILSRHPKEKGKQVDGGTGRVKDRKKKRRYYEKEEKIKAEGEGETMQWKEKNAEENLGWNNQRQPSFPWPLHPQNSCVTSVL